MKLRPLTLVFVLLWLLSAVLTWAQFGAPDGPGTFGDMFGAVNSLFSGIALAMAIYSLILQQRQAEQFESTTLALLEQQAQSMAALKRSLDEQSQLARVSALTVMIEQQNERIEQLRAWGEQGGLKKQVQHRLKISPFPRPTLPRAFASPGFPEVGR